MKTEEQRIKERHVRQTKANLKLALKAQKIIIKMKKQKDELKFIRGQINLIESTTPFDVYDNVDEMWNTINVTVARAESECIKFGEVK